jgi:rhodanese-related sulfurtransferase
MAVQRISPREARQRVQQGEALLVCAYDSMEKFSQVHLEGALSLDAFKARLAELPKSREIIFYCA